MSTATSKFAYQAIPQFNPTFYRAWAADVQDAFAERKWTPYLIPAEPAVTEPSITEPSTSAPSTSAPKSPELDPQIVIQAKALLNQSIPYEHKAGIESCTNAAEIWLALKQRYASQSREDELRLEGQLLDFKKSATDTIDQHIAKFDTLIASIIAQQPIGQQYDDTKKNRYFLRTLEIAQIPNEDWKGFITFLGKSWLTITTHALFAEARTYYNTHIVLGTASTATSSTATTTTTPDATETKVLATYLNPSNFSNRQYTINAFRGRGRCPDRGRSKGRFNNYNAHRHYNNYNNYNGTTQSQRNKLPSDPNAFCPYCRRKGHSYEQCYSKTRDPEYQDHQQSSQHRPHQLPPQYPNPPSYPSHPKDHRVNTIRACKTTSSAKHWIFDSACTEHMTSDPTFFQSYREFQQAIPVHGIGQSTLYARGEGSVYLVSNNNTFTAIHKLNNVWYVPGLNDSIISKHWTQQSNLQLSIDNNQNIVLTSTQPGSTFSATTTDIDRITVLPTVTALNYVPSSVRTMSSSRHIKSSPSRPSSSSHTHPCTKSTTTTRHAQLMHERLGHASPERLRQLGITYVPNCNYCILGKQTRTPFSTIDDQVNEKLEYVYSDICGFITPISYGNSRYILTFIDAKSRYSWVYCIPDKSSSTVLSVLKRWKAMVENQAGTKVKILRTDQGKEYTGVDTITPFLDQCGIVHETTPAYSSSSNGIAERLNRTLLNMVRSMLLQSKIPTPFWAEAVDTANKIRNRLPTRSLPGNISPHEAWFNVRPTISHFRQFGCLAFARIPAKIITPSNKIAPRSLQCCLLGYIGNKIYRLWDPLSKRIIVSRDVIFKENQFLDSSDFGRIPQSTIAFHSPFDDVLDNEDRNLEDFAIPEHPSRPQYLPTPSSSTTTSTSTATPNRLASLAPIPRPPFHDDSDSNSDSDNFSIITPSRQSSPPPCSPHSTSHPTSTPFTTPPTSPTPPPRPASPQPEETRKSNRDRQPTKKAAEAAAGAKLTTSKYIPSFAPPSEPQSLAEALASSQSDKWSEAIAQELESLNKNGTWHIVPRPRNRKIIGTKYVFKLKDSETPNPRYKARLVAQGYNQIPGIDYTDTFSPVVKATSIRLLLALAAEYALHIHQFDVETAFLNPNIDHEVYVEQPPNYKTTYPSQDYVLKLNKALYGLKQSPLLWSKDLKSALLNLNYQQSDADESIFILRTSPTKFIIIAVYVDDILAFAKTTDEINNIFSQLSKRFTLRNLGPVKKFLGIDFQRPHPTGPIFISQSTYARRILHKFGMQNCNPTKAPFENQCQLHKRTEKEQPADPEVYRQMIGSFMHLAIISRPDIAFTVSALSKFNSDPSIHHLLAAKHLLRYIQGTKDFGLRFYTTTSTRNPDISPFGFSDASYASDPDDRKSISGYVFFLANTPISWSAHKQSVVALSTMEAEYIALSDAAKEAIFLRKLLSSLQIHVSSPTLIKTDSDAALDHVKNNIKHPRTKHIDTRHHYIRSVYGTQIDIQHVPAADQTADILTKPLGTVKHLEACQLLNLSFNNTCLPLKNSFINVSRRY